MKREKSKYFFISTCLIIGMSCGRNISNQYQGDGFYRKFSFKKNTGEHVLDTTKSKKENNLLASYCYVNNINDSLKIITFFSNLKNGNYYNILNTKTIWAFTSGKKTIYESDLNSNASGPGKEYRLVSDTMDNVFTLYYYLPTSPITDSINDRTVWLEYHIRGNTERKDSSVLLLIRPVDTVDLKHTLFDSQRLEWLLSNSEVRN